MTQFNEFSRAPIHLNRPCFLATLALFAAALLAQAQSTAFTYNGRLNENGAPANGDYEITFSVYDAESGGNLVAGPQPQPAVATTLVNGLFTARVDFGPGVFTGPARWIELHVRKVGDANFTTVAPRQELTSSPYAIRAESAGTATDVSQGSVVKSLNGLKDDVTLAPGNNVTITPNGNTLTIASAGAGGSGIWSVDGNNTYFTAGNVGIGTTSPQLPLEISRVGPYGRPAAGVTDGGSAWLYLLADNSLHNSLIWDSARDLRFGAEPSIGTGYVEFARITSDGKFGIGTGTPEALLTVHNRTGLGHTAWGIEQENGTVKLSTFLAGGSAMFGTRTPHPLYFLINELVQMAIDTTGNVGIGTSSPTAKLEVNGDAKIDGALTVGDNFTATIGCADLQIGYSGRRGGPGRALTDFGTSLNINCCGDWPSTYVGGGNVSVCNLTIRGGCDLAEPFPISEEHIEKGAVMVIDPNHPGQLKLSTKAYDSRVAGVVSGGRGLNPGISLHQENVMDAGENVALTGRVYVNADAAYGAIEPGDLLTTSDTPGHAMKVSNHAKAQGAILGKAMSALTQGKGMVLVLVTLQ